MSVVPALHAGPFHPLESVLFVLLAIGPLIAAVVVVLVVRRREARSDAAVRDQAPADSDRRAPSVPPRS